MNAQLLANSLFIDSRLHPGNLIRCDRKCAQRRYKIAFHACPEETFDFRPAIMGARCIRKLFKNEGDP